MGTGVERHHKIPSWVLLYPDILLCRETTPRPSPAVPAFHQVQASPCCPCTRHLATPSFLVLSDGSLSSFSDFWEIGFRPPVPSGASLARGPPPAFFFDLVFDLLWLPGLVFWSGAWKINICIGGKSLDVPGYCNFPGLLRYIWSVQIFRAGAAIFFSVKWGPRGLLIPPPIKLDLNPTLAQRSSTSSISPHPGVMSLKARKAGCTGALTRKVSPRSTSACEEVGYRAISWKGFLGLLCEARALQQKGLFWELRPGPLAPEARIMPLDQTASA